VTTQQARLLAVIVHDAHLVNDLTIQAVAAMKNARNGYPTHVLGANPDTPASRRFDPDADVQLTQPERLAITRDRAAHDLRTYRRALEQSYHQLTLAASIAARWTTPAPELDDDGQVLPVRRRVSPDDHVWCDNHLRHGHLVTRAPKGVMCDWCAQFRSKYDQLPSKRILDYRVANGGSIDRRHILRILAAERNEAKQRRAKGDVA
jgi:hypothetical protein